MKLGIIGAGSAARAHGIASTTRKSTDLAGVYDINTEAAEKFCAETAGTAFPSLAAMLDNVDGVVVCSPNFAHYDHICEILSAGKPVLCEKPLAASTDQARQLLAKSEQAHVATSMGFNYRYLPVVKQLRSHLELGDLGRPCAIELAFRKDSALRRREHTWRDTNRSRNTSGALGDLGVHMVDLVSYILDGPIDLSTCRVQAFTAVGEKENQPVEVEDHAEVYAMHTGGAMTTIVTSKISEPEQCGFSIRLIGTKGTFSYHSTQGNAYTLDQTGTATNHALEPALLADPASEFYGWADSFRHQLHSWTELVDHGESTGIQPARFADGLRAQEFLDTCLAATDHESLGAPVAAA